MAADLATLKARLTRELHRSDLASDIANAINEAIRFYRSRNFEFSEKVGSITTVAGTPSYATLPGIGEILNVMATVYTTSYPLDSISFTEYQELSGADSPSGQPQAYALYGGAVYVYPRPNAAYTLAVAYQKRMDAPVLDADVTVWTDEAEPLIRARAKRLICREVMLDADGAAAASEAEREAFGALMNESLRLQDTGRLASHW